MFTGQEKFHKAGMAFLNVAGRVPNVDGLLCTDFIGDDLQCTKLFYTFGAMADSFYEYTLKQWILSKGQDTVGGGWLGTIVTLNQSCVSALQVVIHAR